MTTTTKRQNRREAEDEHEPLLSGFPDHIAQLCLSLVPPSTLYSVSHSYRHLIYSPSFPPFLSLYALFHSTQTQSVHFSSFDPVSSKWLPLPPPPPLRFLLRHPSFISRNFPVQSVSVSGNLVILAVTGDHFVPALSCPLVFDPTTRKWSRGPALSAPRRWCAAGVLKGVIYVASGMGSHYDHDVARSVEKWDVMQQHHWKWEKMGNLKDGKFSREVIEAVGWKGKLCIVNVKGTSAKEGTIYDVERDTWHDMPKGMLGGWRGPAAAMEEETMYVIHESKGLLQKYDHVKDLCVEVVKKEMLKGAQQVAAAAGKVCVCCVVMV